MKRELAWAARLYPLDWRRRYGVEFEALLEQSGGGWQAFADILRGALTMQIKRWSIWKLAAICGLAGAAIAGIVFGSQPKTYVSAGVVLVHSREAPSDTKLWLGELLRDVLKQASLERLIVANGLFKNELQAQMPMTDLVGKMRGDISIELLSDQVKQNSPEPVHAFRITFSSIDPAKAQQIAGQLEQLFVDRNLPLAGAPGTSRSGRLVEVVDLPTPPRRRIIKSALLRSMTGGLLLGILVAVLAGSTRRWLFAARH
jgi:capsular polysaccharide biosynthesis protein